MAEPQPIIARMPELMQLEQFLKRALERQGQVVFLAGEAGTGKSLLAAEFARTAQEKFEELVVATGMCDPQTGAGDPYLPFREILGMLTGNIEDRVAQGTVTQENAERLGRLFVVTVDVLMDNGPDLIGLLVPGGTLLAKLGKSFAQKSDLIKRLQGRVDRRIGAEGGLPTGVEQSQIYEQCVNVLRALAEHSPLLLILDDLHWADPASVGLLFRLGRRLEGSRVLILATYRPEEVLGGEERHPLEKVLTEFKRYFGDVWVDLDETIELRGREFVDTYISMLSSQLGSDFRDALFDHTGGHPLFTIELIQDMVERGDLRRNGDGEWEASPSLDWGALPARVEGVIEERVARLDEDAHRRLTVASVEGELFTAEVIAQIESLKVRELIRELSGRLQREQKVVESHGVVRMGGTRLSRYRFAHSLMQAYLYAELDEVERSYLHEDVGRVLEELFGEESASIAVQLARHFERAELPEKAITYLRIAGDNATAAFANAEAAAYYSRALALVDEEEGLTRLELLLARERVLGLAGMREAQEADLEAAREVAATLDEGEPLRAEVQLRIAQFETDRARYDAAVEAAREASEFAAAADDPVRRAAGARLHGYALSQLGDYPAAREKFELARDLAREAGAEYIYARSLSDLGSVAYFEGDYGGAAEAIGEALARYEEIDDRAGAGVARRNLAIVKNHLGHYAEAREHAEAALAIAREIGHLQEESRCYNTLAQVAYNEGDLAQARDAYQKAVEVHRGLGNRTWEGLALSNLGYVLGELGENDRAREVLEQSLEIQRDTGNRWAQALCLENLGMTLRDLGDHEAARDRLEEGLAIHEEIGSASGVATVLNELGIVACDIGDYERSYDLFTRTLEKRREMAHETLMAEARAGLAETSLALGRPDEAREHVDAILALLETMPTLATAERPFRIYRILIKVLRALDDDRAEGLLAQAQSLLDERATRIGDEAARRSFLENVPVHRKLREGAGALEPGASVTG